MRKIFIQFVLILAFCACVTVYAGAAYDATATANTDAAANASATASANTTSTATASTDANADTDANRNIYIGDIISLRISTKMFSAEELKKKFQEFEIVEIVEDVDGYRLSLRTFETGEYTIILGDKRIVINVVSSMDDIDRTDIFEGDGEIKKPGSTIPWQILFLISTSIFGLTGSYVLVRFIILKRNNKAIPPYQLFLKRAGVLSMEDDGYFVKLTLYLKEFLGSLYHCRIIGKTSTEIIGELKEIQPLSALLPYIGEWLTECDRLKFTGVDVTFEEKKAHCWKLLDLAERIDKLTNSSSKDKEDHKEEHKEEHKEGQKEGLK